MKNSMLLAAFTTLCTLAAEPLNLSPEKTQFDANVTQGYINSIISMGQACAQPNNDQQCTQTLDVMNRIITYYIEILKGQRSPGTLVASFSRDVAIKADSNQEIQVRMAALSRNASAAFTQRQ